MLVLVKEGTALRYGLLASGRTLALERLEEVGRILQVRRRHALAIAEILSGYSKRECQRAY